MIVIAYVSCIISSVNEFDLIEMLMREAPRTADHLALGVGDDCAVIERESEDLLITTDALVEGRHFTLEIIDPHDLGRRSVAVCVSDIAAMGGVPRFATVYLGVPRGFDEQRCQKLYAGMHEAAREYSMALIGGDTTRNDALTLSLTIIGAIDAQRALRRSTAKPGDAIYITGRTGEAALGLMCLTKRIFPPESRMCIDRYRNPKARIAIGQALSGLGMVTAMIDISDGLMADVGHLASASKTGYDIDIDRVPRTAAFERIARIMEEDPVELMLTGGDDYELAFTVAHNRVSEFERTVARLIEAHGVTITRVGSMNDDMGFGRALRTDGSVVVGAHKGYDHFHNTRA